MSAETDAGMDAYDLAMLAAQLMRRQDSALRAVKTALELVEAAKHELGVIQLGTFVNSPEAQTQLEQEETQRLATLKITYENGVKIITSQNRWSYALKWIKEFLAATKYKDRPPEQREPYVEAWQAKHRSQGFTGTEAKKLKEEFEQWRGKGRQGRVRKRATDGRLKENRKKKLQKQGKEAVADLTKPKLGFEAVRPFINRGRKTPRYRDPATYTPDADKP
jgi:hypothetical protein